MFVRKAYNIEQMYLYPAVLDVYKQIENNTRQYLKTLNEELVIAGDRRYDYPGFSAKYCVYLIMETKSGLIIGFKLLSKEDGKGSAALEPMAAKRCLEELIEEGLRIEMFLSNRSTFIKTVLKASINIYAQT